MIHIPKEDGNYKLVTTLNLKDHSRMNSGMNSRMNSRNSTTQLFKYQFYLTIEGNVMKNMKLNFILWSANYIGNPVNENFDKLYLDEKEFIEKITSTLLVTNSLEKCHFEKLDQFLRK